MPKLSRRSVLRVFAAVMVQAAAPVVPEAVAPVVKAKKRVTIPELPGISSRTEVWIQYMNDNPMSAEVKKFFRKLQEDGKGLQAENEKTKEKEKETPEPEPEAKAEPEKPVAKDRSQIVLAQQNARQEAVAELVGRKQLDWVAVEAIPRSFQADVDLFQKAVEGSIEERGALARIRKFLDVDDSIAGIHPAVVVLEEAKKQNKPVHAIGVTTGQPVSDGVPQSGHGLIVSDEALSEATAGKFLGASKEAVPVLLVE